jgi:hypothetical protein
MNKNKRFKLGFSIFGFSAIIGSSIAIVACGDKDPSANEADQKAISDLFGTNKPT